MENEHWCIPNFSVKLQMQSWYIISEDEEPFFLTDHFHPIFLADPWSTQGNYGRQRCMHTMSLEQMTTSQKCLFIQMFWTWQSLCNFSNILYTYKIVLYCCLTMAIFIFLVHQHGSRNFWNWSFTQFFLLHLTLICFWFWPKCWRQSSSYMNKANDIQSV